MRLYDLIPAYKQVAEQIEDCDTAEQMQVLVDTLEAINASIEVKADGYGKIVRTLRHIVAAKRAEAKRMADSARVIETAADKLEERLQSAMELIGQDKIKTDLFSFTIQNNPPALDITDVMALPQEYLVLVPEHYDADKPKIKDALKAGIAIPGARLTQGRSLRIR